MATEFDRVVALLEEEQRHADLAELLMLHRAWRATFDAEPNRRGDAMNLALLQWTGLDVKARLTFVFRAPGINRTA